MTNVAVILARGGSKGIPKKNLSDFCGKPLISWTIEQALSTRALDSVWVSSDDQEILRLSRKYNVGEIKRPKNLSNDNASSEVGWLHALDFLDDQGVPVTSLVAPQCTSPVRSNSDFEGALSKFFKDDLDSLFSATKIPDFNLWRTSKNGQLESFTYDYQQRGRRQEKPDQYLENGSFWIFRPEVIRTHKNRLGGKMGIWLMDFWKSFQIDEPEDIAFCEILMQHYLLNRSQ
jgi:CMP-N,N'-diacetyllegionaminic acid synthase